MKKKLLSIVILVLMVCLNISITVEVFATSASKDVSVESFETINVNDDLIDEWQSYIEKTKEIELEKIINEENLIKEETKKYINQAFSTGEMKSVGTDLTNILPAISMFGNKDGINREVKKQTVFQKLTDFLKDSLDYNYHELKAKTKRLY